MKTDPPEDTRKSRPFHSSSPPFGAGGPRFVWYPAFNVSLGGTSRRETLQRSCEKREAWFDGDLCPPLRVPSCGFRSPAVAISRYLLFPETVFRVNEKHSDCRLSLGPVLTTVFPFPSTEPFVADGRGSLRPAPQRPGVRAPLFLCLPRPCNSHPT